MTATEAKQYNDDCIQPSVQAWEDTVVTTVNDYTYAAPGTKGSMTTQTRRVVKALRMIGVERSDFSARTDYDRRTGVYGTALGSVRSHHGCKLVIKHARLLVRCGLSVHVLNTDPGHESAFVATPSRGEARVIRHASVSGNVDVDPATVAESGQLRRELDSED